MDCSFSKDVVFKLQQCEQTNFHNALFNLYAHTLCTWEATFFEKKQSIA